MSSDKFALWNSSVTESIRRKDLPKDTSYEFTQALYKTTMESVANHIKELSDINKAKQKNKCIDHFKKIYCEFERSILHNKLIEDEGSETYEKALHRLEAQIEWKNDDPVDQEIWERLRKHFSTLMVSSNFQ